MDQNGRTVKTALGCVSSLCLAICCGGVAIAEDTGAQATDAAAASAPEGLLPIPDYTGSFSERAYLTGDWGGARTNLAQRGLQFELDSVSWADGFVDGGRRSNTRGGGNLTFDLKWDLMRAGILPGALITLRAESRWGDSGNFATGQIAPPNTAALTPTNYSNPDAGYDLALTQLNYTQFLSQKFGLVIGKLDLFGEGDTNEFAGGRGKTQFMNWSLNFGNPTIIVPASTIGFGGVYIPNENTVVTGLLTSGTECVNSDCFDDLDDQGQILIGSIAHQYNLNGKPGGVTGQGVYLFDQDFTELDSLSFSFLEALQGGSIGAGFDRDGSDDSWIIGGSVWQYISVEDGQSAGPVNLTNRVPDLRGWGVFGRFYLADEDTNPWKTSVALGVGGRGMFDSRPNDLFGLGYYYNDHSDSLFETRTDDPQGAELFYNFEITPAVRLSANLQYMKAANPDVDDTTLLSARFQIKF